MATTIYVKTDGNHGHLLDVIQTATDYQASKIILKTTKNEDSIARFLQSRFPTYLIPTLIDTETEFVETAAAKKRGTDFDWDSIEGNWVAVENSILGTTKAVELSKAM